MIPKRFIHSFWLRKLPNWLQSINRDLKSEYKPSELQPCPQNQDYCQHHRVSHHTKCCPLHGKVFYFPPANISKTAPSQGFGLYAHLVSLHPSGSSTPSGWCFCHRGVVHPSAEISQILPKIKIPENGIKSQQLVAVKSTQDKVNQCAPYCYIIAKRPFTSFPLHCWLNETLFICTGQLNTWPCHWLTA